MKPDTGARVEAEMEKQIASVLSFAPTRQDAAQFILDMSAQWFWQTPEGEYLLWVSKGEK